MWFFFFLFCGFWEVIRLMKLWVCSVKIVEATARDLIRDEKSGLVQGVVVRPKGQQEEERV